MRETERVMVRMEGQVRERVSDCVSESERLRFLFYFIFIFFTGRVWILSIPYPNYSGNIHTLPVRFYPLRTGYYPKHLDRVG